MLLPSVCNLSKVAILDRFLAYYIVTRGVLAPRPLAVLSKLAMMAILDHVYYT